MSQVYSCPHCGIQNFATQARLRQSKSLPLKCWKCGKEIKTLLGGLRDKQARSEGEKNCRGENLRWQRRSRKG